MEAEITASRTRSIFRIIHRELRKIRAGIQLLFDGGHFALRVNFVRGFVVLAVVHRGIGTRRHYDLSDVVLRLRHIELRTILLVKIHHILIGDGDLSAGIAAAVEGTGVHAVMGSGGAPEGVITAAAVRCVNGYMLGRLVINTPELEERIARMGIPDKNKIYEAEDLAPGKQLIFAATGVTDGALMKGVRFFGEGIRTSSVIMTLRTSKVRFVESIHLEKGPDVRVKF